MTRVLLGSASPARRRVLTDAGLAPLVLVADLDEDALVEELSGTEPESVVTALAVAKGDIITAEVTSSPLPELAAVAADGVIITCDSMLLIGDRLVGKPQVPEVAVTRWREMRGSSGRLLTGHRVSRLTGGSVTATATGTQSTTVHFADVSDEVIDHYVATGEPLYVAGAFTLDGMGGWLLDGIDGDPSSVLGISLPLTRRLLDEVGIDVSTLWSRPRG